MTDLQSLLSRVEGANGPDRELDCLIAAATDYRNRFTGELLAEWLEDPARRAEAMQWEGVPYVTSSLDAALALCERVLPGEAWGLLQDALFDNRVKCSDVSRELPLALLTALLRTLIAQEEDGSRLGGEGASVADIAAAGPSDCAATAPHSQSEGGVKTSSGNLKDFSISERRPNGAGPLGERVAGEP
jgi:hypothetical protein